jgi:hypothetical protein
MITHHLSNLSTAVAPVRRLPLAACVAALFGLAVPEAFAATTWTVTTCADHGSGSLRDIVTNSAVSGDTVDLSKLKTNYGCLSSTVSLTTGAIQIPQQTLFLTGPTDRITIGGYYNGSYENDRIINHTGTGTLSLSYLNTEYGKITAASSGPVTGGCIRSNGSVLLQHVRILGCSARSTASSGSNEAFGGGVYAAKNVIAKYSQIAANTAQSNTSSSFGGGIFAHGNISVSNSTINGNLAGAEGGGIDSQSGATITNSTISGNTAQFMAGGVYAGGIATDSLNISDSTISGNRAYYQSLNTYIGGVFSSVSTTVQNSTIAFNTATRGIQSGRAFAPGLVVSNTGSGGSNIAVDLESSILSNNTYGATEDDFSAISPTGSTVTITSNNNIIRASLGPQRPATVTTACPLLGSLRDNGGSTQTHALLSHSPAIGVGANPTNLSDDQRGPGYPRMSGSTTDIGAYEVQQADIIFNSGFEGCPALQ